MDLAIFLFLFILFIHLFNITSTIYTIAHRSCRYATQSAIAKTDWSLINNCSKRRRTAGLSGHTCRSRHVLCSRQQSRQECRETFGFFGTECFWRSAQWLLEAGTGSDADSTSHSRPLQPGTTTQTTTSLTDYTWSVRLVVLTSEIFMSQ